MYQLEGRDLIFEWLEHETDSELRQGMLDWLALLADDPDSIEASRVPGVRAPVFLAVTPVRNVTVTFLRADQFRVLKIIRFDTLP